MANYILGVPQVGTCNTVFGENTYADGYCCIAIGDNAHAVGSFVVDIREPITLPWGIYKDNYMKYVNHMIERKRMYLQISEINNVPHFYRECVIAFDKVINVLNNKYNPKMN